MISNFPDWLNESLSPDTKQMMIRELIHVVTQREPELRMGSVLGFRNEKEKQGVHHTDATKYVDNFEGNYFMISFFRRDYRVVSPLYVIIDLHDLSDCKVVNDSDYTVTAAKLRNQTLPDLFRKYFPNLAAAPRFGV